MVQKAVDKAQGWDLSGVTREGTSKLSVAELKVGQICKRPEPWKWSPSHIQTQWKRMKPLLAREAKIQSLTNQWLTKLWSTAPKKPNLIKTRKDYTETTEAAHTEDTLQNYSSQVTKQINVWTTITKTKQQQEEAWRESESEVAPMLSKMSNFQQKIMRHARKKGWKLLWACRHWT